MHPSIYLTLTWRREISLMGLVLWITSKLWSANLSIAAGNVGFKKEYSNISHPDTGVTLVCLSDLVLNSAMRRVIGGKERRGLISSRNLLSYFFLNLICLQSIASGDHPSLFQTDALITFQTTGESTSEYPLISKCTIIRPRWSSLV